MLDEEKIKLMTKVSIYEKNEELDDLVLSRYFKEDYVKYGCLKTIVIMTICYWICIALYVLINFEKVMNEINSMDYFRVIYVLLGGYVITIAVFFIYAFIVYNYKYSKAKPGIIKYNHYLTRLIKLYEKEEAHDQIVAGKVRVYSEIGGSMEESGEN